MASSPTYYGVAVHTSGFGSYKQNWLHVVGHLVIAAAILPLVSWGVSSLVMLVTKKVAPRTV